MRIYVFIAQNIGLHLERGIPFRNKISHFYLKSFTNLQAQHKSGSLSQRGLKQKMQISHSKIFAQDVTVWNGSTCSYPSKMPHKSPKTVEVGSTQLTSLWSKQVHFIVVKSDSMQNQFEVVISIFPSRETFMMGILMYNQNSHFDVC